MLKSPSAVKEKKNTQWAIKIKVMEAYIFLSSYNLFVSFTKLSSIYLESAL